MRKKRYEKSNLFNNGNHFNICIKFLSKSFFKQDANATQQNSNTSFSEKVISNNTQAIQIAEKVLTEELKRNRNDFEIVETMFEEKNKVWIVTYLIDEKTVGGDISISISEKTGEIISINYGE